MRERHLDPAFVPLRAVEARAERAPQIMHSEGLELRVILLDNLHCGVDYTVQRGI
jgi:hypothetical protein